MAWNSEPAPVTPADLRELERVPIEERVGGTSVYDVFVAAAQARPESTAITMLMTGAPDEQPRTVTTVELLALVTRAANFFSGLAPDRPGVAYMLPSLVETHATLWGAETAGYAVPINFLLQPSHIADLIEASGATVLVALGPHPQLDIWEKAVDLQSRLPGVTLVRVGAGDGPQAGTAGESPAGTVLDFGEGLAAQPADRLLRPARRGRDVAAYFHTGGTTGAPKLVAHTHQGQLAAAAGGALMTQMSAADRMTANLPLFHVAGTIFTGLCCFLAGTEVVIMTPSGMRNPAMVAGFWRILEQYRITLAGSVPTAVGAVLEVPLDGADITAVRAGFCGAASLPTAVALRWRAVTGTALHEVYGMTEASGLIAIDPTGGEATLGSVGLPLPYTRVSIRRTGADGELGAQCEPGEVGALTVQGPTVSPGYRDPRHDQGVLFDGGLNSGDLAYLDDEGKLHIAGRAEDLIIRGGHNIDPLMIENALQAHPAVALAAAVGMPDAYAGELPVCYVVLKAGETVTAEELTAHAQTALAERPAWPKEIVVVQEIPLTSVGKIFKPALRQDVVRRLVQRVVAEASLGPAIDVDVREGGPRGLTVVVTLASEHAPQADAVSAALSAYLFETQVLSC